MTTARESDYHDPRDGIIAGEIRAEISRQRRSQAKIAVEVFRRPPQWLSRRLIGEVPLTAAEMLTLADHLGVDVVDWLNATKGGPSGPVATSPYPVPYLICADDLPELSAPLRGWRVAV